MTGSMTINIIVTFGLMTAVLVGVMIATLPDLPVTPLLVALVGIGIVVPIAIHPLSCTVWAAVDLAMHPPDAGELEQARSALDGGTPASPPSASS